MNSHIQEISIEKAWRIIHAMQVNNEIIDYSAIIRISCYLEKSRIKIYGNNFGYTINNIRKFKKPFPYNLFPIPCPNYFYLYNIELNHIYDLAWLCNQFLMFEIVFVDKLSMENIKDDIILSKNTLYDNFLKLSNKCEKFCVCGFDFDDPHYDSGVSQVLYYNFIPTQFSLYF